jgi:hypothetical protein
MFNEVSYRRGVIEGVILYTLGRLGAMITPAFFPGWLFVIAPLLFLVLQFLIAPYWATRRIKSTKRERLSKRFWLLGPRMAAICFCIDLVISFAIGLALFTFEEVQQGPVIWRFFTSGQNHLSLLQLGAYELRSAALLLSFFTLTVVCTRLAQGGFLRFTMPAGGNRVTL